MAHPAGLYSCYHNVLERDFLFKVIHARHIIPRLLFIPQHPAPAQIDPSMDKSSRMLIPLTRSTPPGLDALPAVKMDVAVEPPSYGRRRGFVPPRHVMS